MQVKLSGEATVELTHLRGLDRDIGESLQACIEMLALEVNEFEGHEGFSIKRVIGLYRKGIRISRVKYEKYIRGLRILFFVVPGKQCVFVSGIHARGDLGEGNNYDFLREPFVRAQRYWGMRDRLCA